MNFCRKLVVTFISIYIWGCKQEVIIKDGKFTGINPVSHTDVIYKGKSDTVLVSTYDGKIYEVIKGKSSKKQLTAINDEIYAIAYNSDKDEIYAATLNSGIAVIDVYNGNILKYLPLNDSWAKQLVFNSENGILATYDYKGNHYLWRVNDGFKRIHTPIKLQELKPRHIHNNGDIYFEDKRGFIVWNYQTNFEEEKRTLKGGLADIDKNKDLLLINGKEFTLYRTTSDKIQFTLQHPDWPIYVPERDTTIDIPLSLEIVSGQLSEKYIFTCGLDKSIRKWDKQSGELVKTYGPLRNTPSGIAITEDEMQFVVTDLGGNILFRNID
ncbi:WD40 repeat domain-containing protein [Salinimicrobium sp. MT39]|uniref:WD40 repeat domain-containing protein n=1 Tax=Salinimicrobium profundisediminis TaxID=2994553 RepID=A0A9X3I1H2_9FLAO|nr:WD40 repeat domain-containing protein [Salinimicrobium profundisediminis]MCX2839075.1 WD40 repeat domain-containing protein [Salinimicrobium profundisediminis]